jgi:hypothetical protein
LYSYNGRPVEVEVEGNDLLRFWYPLMQGSVRAMIGCKPQKKYARIVEANQDEITIAVVRKAEYEAARKTAKPDGLRASKGVGVVDSAPATAGSDVLDLEEADDSGEKRYVFTIRTAGYGNTPEEA